MGVDGRFCGVKNGVLRKDGVLDIPPSPLGFGDVSAAQQPDQRVAKVCCTARAEMKARSVHRPNRRLTEIHYRFTLPTSRPALRSSRAGTSTADTLSGSLYRRLSGLPTSGFMRHPNGRLICPPGTSC